MGREKNLSWVKDECKIFLQKGTKQSRKEHIVLQILKEDRDNAIALYIDEADENLNAIFLEDVKILAY